MQAESVLIDRIPGKSTVGIQIPNPNREQISLRELLESDAYKRSASKLTLALGKTIHGEPFVSDLATMPHLLIAGSTGTGKSVSVNAMLTSILFRATPDDVRLHHDRSQAPRARDVRGHPAPADPGRRRSEAGGQRAALGGARDGRALQDARGAFGVRNIEQYNRNIRAMQAEKKGEPVIDDKGNEIKPLPFIVVLIDELADLMMVAGNEVEESICAPGADGARGRHPSDSRDAAAVGRRHHRPDQGEPAGAHLVPRVLEDRLANDSRRQRRRAAARQGRHALPAAGLVALRPPARALHLRTGERAAGQLPAQAGQADLRHDDHRRRQERRAGAIEFDKDELYDEASRIVVSSGQASISYLQRRLRIGFSRAARLVDMMEADGLVSAAAGGKPREVLVKKDYFDEVDAQLR